MSTGRYEARERKTEEIRHTLCHPKKNGHASVMKMDAHVLVRLRGVVFLGRGTRSRLIFMIDRTASLTQVEEQVKRHPFIEGTDDIIDEDSICFISFYKYLWFL